MSERPANKRSIITKVLDKLGHIVLVVKAYSGQWMLVLLLVAVVYLVNWYTIASIVPSSLADPMPLAASGVACMCFVQIRDKMR